jgi:GT2 family glycosyltransferase
MTAYVQNKFQAHMTMAAIANITRYTNTDEYELILMSDSEKYQIRDDYHLLKIDKYIKTEGESYTQAMNHGAREAKGKYLVFIQNDVFVWESWLPDLRDYLEMEIADCVIPDQVPRDRDFVLKSYEMNHIECMQYGSRDEGLLMITRKGFDKTGGFNENLTLLQARDFYQRMARAGLKQIDTCRVMITHIMAATNLDRLDNKPDEYNEMIKHDERLLNAH